MSKLRELLDIGENNVPVLDVSHLNEFPDNSNEEIERKNIFVVKKGRYEVNV